MKLIIPMAGRGKRLRPQSNVTPKPLLSIAGKTVVETHPGRFQRGIAMSRYRGRLRVGPQLWPRGVAAVGDNL